MTPDLDQIVSSTSVTSGIVGKDWDYHTEKDKRASIYAYLDPDVSDRSSSWEVALQASFVDREENPLQWEDIGRFSDSDVTDTSSNVTLVDVQRNLRYRFRHVSGAAVRVMIGY